MNDNYEQLEQLMLQKDFEDLSLDEQQYVQHWMSPQIYQQQRLILIKSKQILSQKKPLDGNTLEDLQARFKAKHQPQQQTPTSIPIYQAILAAVLVGIIVGWFRPVTETVLKKEVVYLPKVDTIIQEKIRIQEKIVYRTKIVEVPILKIDTIYVPTLDKTHFYQEKDTSTIFAKQHSKGKSIREMGDLMNFVVGAN
ncbi:MULTISPECIES: hypothetical protein [unclassified Aureispira]|uniref:hypothetical protein n=1 Tax=unclassified Aureispira TaxID=2649989 RepID=UPI0006960FBD|nr:MULTISPECIES: hypothetical protein [unclassified Aureispira]WMX15644.1 hypothetical protein QP953_04525 [Aureispira sp. CCB-E]